MSKHNVGAHAGNESKRLRARAEAIWRCELAPWEREQLLALANDMGLPVRDVIVAELVIASAAAAIRRLDTLSLVDLDDLDDPC